MNDDRGEYHREAEAANGFPPPGYRGDSYDPPGTPGAQAPPDGSWASAAYIPSPRSAGPRGHTTVSADDGWFPLGGMLRGRDGTMEPYNGGDVAPSQAYLGYLHPEEGEDGYNGWLPPRDATYHDAGAPDGYGPDYGGWTEQGIGAGGGHTDSFATWRPQGGGVPAATADIEADGDGYGGWPPAQGPYGGAGVAEEYGDEDEYAGWPPGDVTRDPASADIGPHASRGGAVSAWERAQQSPRVSRDPRRRRGRHRSRRSWLVELPVLLMIAGVLALVLKTFAIQAFYIPTDSMEPTIDPGDKVLVNKLVYDFRSVQPGDIVVFPTSGLWNKQQPPPSSLWGKAWNGVVTLFSEPPGSDDYIKRVIGVGGDRVACCNAEHQVTVNGVPLSESSYVYPGNAPSIKTFSRTVPKGMLWVMGDHRLVSDDSRYHMTGYPDAGYVPENRVVGRAFMIIAPFSRWRILPIPSTFLQPKVVASVSAAMAAANPAGGSLLTPAADGVAAMAAPLVPAAPLVLGFTGALPLTWLQRRLRRRLGKRA